MPGVGAGRCPGSGAFGGAGAAEAAGAAGVAAGGATPESAGCAGAGAGVGAGAGAGTGAGAPLPTALSRAASRDLSGALAAGLAPDTFCGALATPLAAPVSEPFAGADLPPPNDSRSLRATGASTVDEADLTNSPCSLSRASTSLLVTPSSLANSCTRALPATTSPVHEATVVGRASGFSYDTLSSGLHGVLMFFATCSVARRTGHIQTTDVLDHRGYIR